MENPIETVASKLSEGEKDLIVSLKSANDIQMRSNLYSTPALNEFFRLWSIHFPSIKQSMNCKGCRETVVKFYSRVADYINTENVKKENEKIKKEKLVKYLEKANKKLKTTKSKKKLSKK